jgi:putative transposase
MVYETGLSDEECVGLPKRWVVERTFSWLGNFRRLSKDFEIRPATAENRIRIAMLKMTLAKCF